MPLTIIISSSSLNITRSRTVFVVPCSEGNAPCGSRFQRGHCPICAIFVTAKRKRTVGRRESALPKPLTFGAKADGCFGKQDFVYRPEEDFVYRPEEDVYCCPAGETLKGRYTNVENVTLRRYWTAACHLCPIKSRCTPESAGSPAGSTRPCSKPCSGASTKPDGHARAARDRRTPLRHDQGRDGRDALPDEDAAARLGRDGAARPPPQSHSVMNIMGSKPLLAAVMDTAASSD